MPLPPSRQVGNSLSNVCQRFWEWNPLTRSPPSTLGTVHVVKIRVVQLKGLLDCDFIHALASTRAHNEFIHHKLVVQVCCPCCSQLWHSSSYDMASRHHMRWNLLHCHNKGHGSHSRVSA